MVSLPPHSGHSYRLTSSSTATLLMEITSRPCPSCPSYPAPPPRLSSGWVSSVRAELHSPAWLGTGPLQPGHSVLLELQWPPVSAVLCEQQPGWYCDTRSPSWHHGKFPPHDIHHQHHHWHQRWHRHRHWDPPPRGQDRRCDDAGVCAGPRLRSSR